MKYIYLLFLLILVGCSKPDPTPELKDPIYSDLNADLSAATAAYEAEKVNLKKFEEELLAVVPQTGQIKYATKRVDDSKSKLVKLQQEKEFLELKVASRLKLVRTEYLKAYNSKQDWPNPQEWENYKIEKKLRLAKRSWDVKERMKEAGVGLDPTEKPTPAAGH